jgi:putative membrane protein
LATYTALPSSRPPGSSRATYADLLYNLFLAIVGGGIGIAAVAMGHNAVGLALIFAGVGSMAAAAVVLLLLSPDKARAALTQGTFPLIAIVLLMLGLTSS